jgi:hypothetical protein
VKRVRILLILGLAVVALDARPERRPWTVANDDSCDIGIAPAATLLLPFFEVDFDSVTGRRNTLFTITNTGQRAQIARVTLWTDFAYPVLTFDLYLTGYDVQSVSLYDVFGRGIIGGEQGTGVDVSPIGELSKRNPLLDQSGCGQLPRRIEPALLTQLRIAFTKGVVPGCPNAGNVHQNARGYATIDVVGNCAPGRGPTDSRYFSEDIRYDNVLMGDYIFVDAGESFAQASPMVHIRALPGGGTQATRIPELPGALPRLGRTFYGRLQDPARPGLDARQPLPSTFAVRWINGGTGQFNTSLQIWRDGLTGSAASCADYEDNGEILVAESVAFDEDENGLGSSLESEIFIPNPIGREPIVLPATSNIAAGDWDVFPQDTFEDEISGWVYFNLDDGKDDDHRGAHQNWVVVTIQAQGLYSATFDAAWLGNGCSPAVGVTDYTKDESTIMPGPAEDVNP